MEQGNARTGLEETRRHGDRRQTPTNPLSLSSLQGRRESIRREDDRATHFYVDRYQWQTFLLVLTIATCCILDTFYTLELIAKGGTELNPFMAALLEIGPLHFFQAKYLLTTIGVLWLLAHKNFQLFHRRVKAGTILGVLAFAYVGLICYELSLL